ncbi:MAG: ABC transporter ATP-binding protein [Orrella sp.]
MNEVLTLKGLNAWYGLAKVLFDVDLTINRGEVVALMGRNGAGKSTLLKAAMGLLERRKVTMTLFGRSTSSLPPYQMARLGLGYVPQDRRIFTDLTVLENLLIAQRPGNFWPDGTAGPTWSPERLFELFPNLAQRRDYRASQMSGGEQQMLSVARTLMGNPLVLLLDEPSEGVAPVIVDQMQAMVATLKQQGVSLLLSEQNLVFAQAVSDRAYLLEQGHVRFEGPMQTLVAQTALCQRYLGISMS